MSRKKIPLASYRIQFTPEFRFEEARALVSYLNKLGITHVYSSPILQPRSGSTHGYDVTDPSRVNFELGGEDDLKKLIGDLHEQSMGFLLDIVPNHMAAVSENPYWDDVLTYGPNSPYARWFDIDWRLPDPKLWGRVLVPILGEPLPRIISQDQLAVSFENGHFRVRYYEHSFPLDPATIPRVLAVGKHKLSEQVEIDSEVLHEFRSIRHRLRSLPRRTTRMRKRIEMPVEKARKAVNKLQHLSERSPRIQAWLKETAQEFASGPEGHHRLRKLLGAQSYRLAYWRRAARVINYRRFFDINDLIALRQEDPEVFDQTHALVIKWAQEGLLDGLRVDHVDGLRDPLEYLKGLSSAIFQEGEDKRSPVVYVEKILGHEEHLRENWPIAGTSGYEFASQVETIFLSPQGVREIEQQYHRLLRRRIQFKGTAHWGKRRVLKGALSAFVGKLARTLLRLSQYDPENADLKQRELVEAIVEVIVCLSIYRTYIGNQDTEIGPIDRQYIEAALAGARRRERVAPTALDFLEEVLLLKGQSELPENEQQERLNFIQRFQQLSGPATAKGVEDTALYVYVPLVSRNEVGGEPDQPLEHAVDDLHKANKERINSWPQTMLAATTHDTKRSADVRSRLSVLSELPKLWDAHVSRWRSWNRQNRSRINGRLAPDTNTEYLFYQTLIGIWPAPNPRELDRDFPNRTKMEELRRRVEEYMLKAVREAKLRTSWVDPNQGFEQALIQFVRTLLDPEQAHESRFLKDVHEFVTRIARSGFWNSLSRTLLQLTVPGMPDTYQGDECWNFSLVDPDNRRPVDFQTLHQLLDSVIQGFETPEKSQLAFLQELVEGPEDGRIKLHLIRNVLQTRRQHPHLFVSGDYQPLTASGDAQDHIFTFAREVDQQKAVVIVPRLVTSLIEDPMQAPIGPDIWSGTQIHLPARFENLQWNSVLTGETFTADTSDRRLSFQVVHLLKSFPAALLVANASTNNR